MGLSVLFLLISLSCDRPQTSFQIRFPGFKPEKFESGPGPIKPEHVGFLLYSPEENRIYDAHNSSGQFIPASTAKVATYLAALQLLGEGERISTLIATTGSVENGILVGDLYIKGFGDPLLRMRDLEQMAYEFQKLGIKRIHGKFYYDDSYLPSTPLIDGTMDPDGSYNAGIGALSLDYNSFNAYWPKMNRTDRETYIVPALPNLKLELSKKEAEEEVLFFYKQNGDREEWTLHPDEKIYDFKVSWTRLPIHNPGLYTAHTFRHILNQKGIELPVPERKVLAGGFSTLIEHRGEKLGQLADSALEYSNNIMTELFFLIAMRNYGGELQDYHDASRRIKKYYRTNIPGVDWTGFHMENGSGLSSKTNISPEQMVAILLYARNLGESGEMVSLRNLLPLGAWDWSLRNRMNKPPYALRMRAKTGAINYAIALTGWLVPASGKELAFAFFVNDQDLRIQHENNPRRREKEFQKDAARWSWQAKKIMDQKIQDWIENF